MKPSDNFATLAAHLGHFDTSAGLVPQIQTSTTYRRDVDYVPMSEGNVYGRDHNDTVRHAEAVLAQMEQALIMQHASTVNEYYRAIADYLAQKESAELAQTIRNQRRREYEEGVGSSTALTQSETQYQQALQSMFLAAQTVLDQQAELEYLMTQQPSK